MGSRRPTVVRLVTALLSLAGPVALAGCAATEPPGTITLYNGQHVQTIDALVTAFEHKTGIQVRVHSDDESVLVDQLVTEGPRSPADVVVTENTPALQYLEERHLLAHLPASATSGTTARFDSEGSDWIGISARVSVLVYNTRLITPADLPSSVLQLADPRFAGRLGLAPGETDFQPVVTSVLRAEGRPATLRWLQGMKANAAGHLYPDNETLVSEVNAGQVALGVINQYYWYRLRQQVGPDGLHSAIAPFAPRDPGYVIDVSGAGVLAASTHRADATRFVQFLASRAAQEIIARSDSDEYPIDAGVARTGETPFAELRPAPVSLAELGDGSAAVALLQQVQLL
jgi:iron(III) transport system substrate-binding protein